MVSVRNKILYRQACHMKIQASIRGWLCRLEYRPRIKGLGRIHKLHDQIEPMRVIVDQLKKEKDSAKKKVSSLEKGLEEAIGKIQVYNNNIIYKGTLAKMQVIDRRYNIINTGNE